MYGTPSITATFDDRALTHWQIVITAKLRRRESFLFSWNDSTALGSGRHSIWLDATSTISYHFAGSRPPSINRDWLTTLSVSANSGTGLVYTQEPQTPSHTAEA